MVWMAQTPEKKVGLARSTIAQKPAASNRAP
jgi:hypothetical protein